MHSSVNQVFSNGDLLYKILTDTSEGFLRGRGICKAWKNRIDNKILPALWNQLWKDAPEGVIHLKSEMKIIENQTTNSLERFKKLFNVFHEHLSKTGEKKKPSFLPHAFALLQKQVHDAALKFIWDKSWHSSLTYAWTYDGDGPQGDKPPAKDAEAEIIRNYLKDNTLFLEKRKLLRINGDKINREKNLKILPPEINLFKKVIGIDLSKNDLKVIPIFKFENLKLVNLEGNQLREIQNFSGCPHLEEMHLENNKLTEVPDFYGPNLKHIYLSGNSVTQVPNFTHCPNLKTIHADTMNF